MKYRSALTPAESDQPKGLGRRMKRWQWQFFSPYVCPIKRCNLPSQSRVIHLLDHEVRYYSRFAPVQQLSPSITDHPQGGVNPLLYPLRKGSASALHLVCCTIELLSGSVWLTRGSTRAMLASSATRFEAPASSSVAGFAAWAIECSSGSTLPTG